MTDITDDVKALSGSLRGMATNISNITNSIERIARVTAGEVSGIKAGFDAALSVIARHYTKRVNKQ